jgi:hypothetical protein
MTATPRANGRESFADHQRTDAPALKLRTAGPPEGQAGGGPADPAQGSVTSADTPHAEGTGEVRGLYCELLEAAYPELRRRADAGEEGAQHRLQRFIALGERLGVRLPGRGEEGAECAAAGTVAALVTECLARRRIPSATYRLQFNGDFTFADARDLVPYLHALGVSDCYASPLLQACAGSSHGYDTCDHGRLNPELGGEQGFDGFAAALREHGMGLVLDAVPNHMGIADPRNA